MNDVTQPAAKRARTLQKGRLEVFEEACNGLNLPAETMAVRLGFSAKAPAGWRKDGAVPKVVEIACGTMLDLAIAQREADATSAPEVFVLVVRNASQSAAVLSVCEALGATLTRVPT